MKVRQKYQNLNEIPDHYVNDYYIKLWNYHSPAFYQPCKFEDNLYIFPFDITNDAESENYQEQIEHLQYWLNMIDLLDHEKNYFSVSINGDQEKFASPLVMLIGTYHGNKINSRERIKRCRQFRKESDRVMSSYYLEHFCYPEIFIHCIENGNLNCCDPSEQDLLSLILNIAKASPLANVELKTKWLVLASLISEHVYEDENGQSNDHVSSKEKQLIKTFRQVKCLANNLTCTIDEELKKLLTHLRKFGKIMYSDDLEQTPMITTDTNWLHHLFSEISRICDSKEMLPVSGLKKILYEKFRNEGIVHPDLIECLLSHYKLKKEDICQYKEQ